MALLAIGGIALVVVAAHLATVALHWRSTPVSHLPLPADHGVRGVWLLVVAGVLALLLWLAMRRADTRVWLPSPDGGLSLSGPQLDELAAHAAERDTEVVRAEAQVRARRGGLTAAVRVYGRPLGDARALAEDAEARVRAALLAATGAPEVRVRARARVLPVRQLVRYLP